ncbi:AAA family ATPase [uncultured Corynebacterium sp.]|uniref:ATP-binding protein n=1 Tax=uncultured Corynebacterium sp. TaxID=159447 RepID=UPI0025FC7D9E|nr:AAA family ATPase [uncultured Corynebacterium sp.]
MLILHSLTLDHVAGVDHAHLELPETGVVVVHGPNEMGKSTLLAAFDLLLSDTGVNSKAGRVRALKSATEDVATTVSAEMTIAGYRLAIRKSFNKSSGRCELTVTSPRPENLTGRQAAERFGELLAEGVDTTLVKALTIRQGASLDILAATGIPSLEQALGGDAPDGAGISGGGSAEDGAAALIGRIADEYQRYFTPGGKASKELVAAEKSLAEATEDHQAATGRYSQAQSLIAELEQLTAEKATVAKQEPVAVEAATGAEQALVEGRAAVAELDGLRKAVTAAAGVRDLADQRARVRGDRVSDLTDAEKTVAELDEAVREAAAAAELEAQTTVGLQEKLGVVRRRSRVASAWVARVEALDRRRAAEKRAGELTDRITAATDIADEVRELGGEVEDNPVTDAVLASLRAADATLYQAVSVRDAVATTVEVDGPDGAAVTVGGESRDLREGSTTVHVTGRQEIGLGDWTVTVTPARDVREVSEDVTRARAELDRLLAASGVGDLAEAEDVAAQRQTATERHREAVLRLTQITGSATVEDLRAQRDRESAEASRFGSRADEALAQVRAEDPEGVVDLAGVPAVVGDESGEVGEVSATAADLTAVADAAVREADRIQEDLDQVMRAGAAVRLEGRRAELERATAGRDRLAAALAADRENRDDDALANDVAEATTALAGAQEALAEAEERTGVIDLQTLTSLVEGAAARVRRLRERAEEAGHSVSRVTGALGEHAGVADEVENTRIALQRAERAHRRVSAQAEAAALLYREVQDALARARERYEAPLRATVEKLARTLYGAPVHFEFGDDLSPARRSLDGVTLDTTQLSGGAREQISVLTRLAVADLVGGGDAVPVFIDDALGFSDRGRIDRMNAVLDTLGRDHQIIVLTCDLDRFDGIAGATLVPMRQVLAQ